jgi:hypothetical protein
LSAGELALLALELCGVEVNRSLGIGHVEMQVMEVREGLGEQRETGKPAGG